MDTYFMALISEDRYITDIHPDLPIEDKPRIKHLINAASELVEEYTQRKFNLATYDQIYHGTGNRFLFLKNRPIVKVRSVRYGQQIALWFLNTDANNYNAT